MNTLRCALHPGRPAVDTCPACGRPRCGRDAQSDPATCPICRRPAEPAHLLESLVAAALAASAAAIAGAVITSEYVGAQIFSVVTPALLGIACGFAATAAARVRPGSAAHRAVRALAVLYALIGTAYGFRLVVGRPSAFGPAGQVVPPYLAAALGAWLSTLPPRRQRRAGRGTRS
jgi:hypothetical protein